MQKFTSLSLIFMLLAFIACNNEASLKNKISGQEKQLYDNEEQAFNEELMNNLSENYTKFANQYPGDSLAAEYLFKAADIKMNIAKEEAALELLDKILQDYPDFEKRAEAMFLKGYIYENYQGDLAQAEELYKTFLEQYPNHEFADDAEMSLKYLGKSPEELVKQFEK